MKSVRMINIDYRCIELEEWELPPVPDDGVLVQNEYTAVSVGTESYSYFNGCELGGKPSFLRNTGYCNAGVVLEVGRDVRGLTPRRSCLQGGAIMPVIRYCRV